MPHGSKLHELGGHLVSVKCVRVVAAGNLGIQLHTHARFDVVFGQVHPLHHFNACTSDCLVFLVAHGAQPVDATDAHPVEHVRHHSLKPCITDASNRLRMVEICVCSVTTRLVDSGIVDAEFNNFTQASAFLSKINNHAHTTTLGTLNSLPESEDEVWPATADVASKNIGANALIMNTHHSLSAGVAQFACIAKGVDCASTHCRDVCLDVRVKQPIIM
mmetsp:Transcript_35789/g.70954  ORF Transcript_35789/g.70954 Transcript_35789/m.70954 type:complete len:218 (+) Transcript_35789:1396-2049(+)